MPHNLTCTECLARLPWYVAGSLAADERSALEQHLASCVDCRREAATWEAITAMLDDKDRRISEERRAGDAWLDLRNRLPAQTPIPVRKYEHEPHRTLEVGLNAHGTGSPHAFRLSSKQLRHPARYLALLVAAVLIVLSVALFGVFGGQLRRGKAAAVTATSTPASCPTSALSATIPADAIIQDISMTSPRDGWAVGWIEIITPQDNVVVKGAVLLHLQNCHWQQVDATSIPAAELASVSMTSTLSWGVII